MTAASSTVGHTERGIWIFGYGSLIWRPGFSYEKSQLATVAGYRRSFCQASHDHRGTPEQPGRVVTLEKCSRESCQGVAFLVVDDSVTILDALDIREQDGYQRCEIALQLEDGSDATAITWIADESNASWRGGEPEDAVAELIASCEGPSGTNSEYLFELDRALRSLNIVDARVSELTERVQSLTAWRASSG